MCGKAYGRAKEPWEIDVPVQEPASSRKGITQ